MKIQLEQALLAIGDGMSVRKAAKTWSVPRSTLIDLKGGLYLVSSRPGPNPVMTAEEEKLICEWIMELARRGIPLSRTTLLDTIQDIINSDSRPNPFTNGRPGRSWFSAFLKRHPEISQKNAESICRGRGALTEGCIRGWFIDAKEYFKEKDISYVLNNPECQYNADETGFQLDPKQGHILAPKGESVYTESGGRKDQVTVLVTTRADGKMMSPAIVYPYKKAIPLPIIENLPDGYSAAKSDTGWMTSTVFYEYLGNVFIPEVNDERRKKKGLNPEEELILDDQDWIVLWIDGYSSHLTLHASKLCDLNKIVLYCFKAHSSHVCQPNDVGPFKPLKAEWRNAVAEWRLGHPYEVLSRANFAPILAKAITKLSPQAIVAGYKATGLYPFDENAVHYERLTAATGHIFIEEHFATKRRTWRRKQLFE